MDDNTTLDALIKMRASLTEEKTRIDGQLAKVNERLLELLSVGESYTSPEGRVSVSVKRSFKASLADKIMDQMDIDPKIREAVMKTSVDSTKVRVLLPDVYAAATVESDPFIRMTEGD